MSRAKRVLVTGGAGFIRRTSCRHLLRATPSRSYPGRAHLRGEHGQHRRPDRAHERLLVRRRATFATRICPRGRGRRRRDRQRGRRVARGEVDRRGRVRVRDDQRRRHADPARRDPPRRRSSASSSSPRARSTAPPSPIRWTRSTRSTRAPVRRDEGRRRPPRLRYCVTYGLPVVIVRPFNNYGPSSTPRRSCRASSRRRCEDEPLTVHGDGHASRDWLLRRGHLPRRSRRSSTRRSSSIAGEVINVATGIDIDGDRHRRRRSATSLGKAALA